MGGLDHDEAVRRQPFSEERWFEWPWPCESRMIGSSLPVTGRGDSYLEVYGAAGG